MTHIKTTRSIQLLQSETWKWFVITVMPKSLNQSLLVFAAQMGK
jgi:hypothetical protein